MKLYLIALAFFLPIEAHSGWFNKYSTIRDCQSFEQARKCQEGCSTSSPSLRVTFEVNAANNTVIWKVLDRGETAPMVESLAGCSVVDSDNWICRTSDRMLDPTIGSRDYLSHHQMVDGLYSSHYRYFSNLIGISSDRIESYKCARP